MLKNKKIQISKFFKDFDKLQKIYGDKNLDAVYGTGKIKQPKICFVFMNPTAKNVATDKKWKGLKAQWLGTKNIWKMFFQLGFLDKNIFKEIKNKKPVNWNYAFAEKIYREVEKKDFYITNLSKATLRDATNPSNIFLKKYLELLRKEISILNPKIIITFGNQVSSIVLGKNIKVSENRKKKFILRIDKKEYQVFPVYYPVGQGQRNIKKAKEDIQWILKNN